tara:strand:- start:906 stop:2582 length:1677 start_codon:yes stop_codon:yes gene_type:complete
MPHALTIDDVLALREFPIICGPQFDFDPAGERLAFCLPGSRAESARFFLDAIGGGEGELYIVDLATSHIRRLPALDDLGVLSPVWSPDGTRIALAVTDGISLRPAVIDVESGAMRVVSERNLTLPGTRTFFHWLDDAALACEITVGDRPTLWMDIEKRGAMASIANWRKAWSGRAPTASPLSSDQPDPVLEETALCLLDIETGRCETFDRAGPPPDRLKPFVERPKPDYPPRVVGPGKAIPPESILMATHPERSEAIYLVRSDDATRVLRQAAGAVSIVFETDTHMAEVAPSRSFLMPFVTAAGEKTQLRCILPPDYQEGQKRPAVLWVYPGFKAGSDMAHRQDPLNQPGMFNLHLLAARGFVVIIPSMPYDEAALGDRVLADCLTDSTRPACGAVVEAGYVDPERIHVAGHSLGGWATLVLLTKTKEFRSGIALAGSSNLLSQTDDVRLRFDTIVDDSRSPGLADNYHLSEPPWKALDQYLRNSPLFSVEDIAAPVLMIHGDQDYVEIGQSEQMFAALRSLGKPAEFVRYWGEGHVLESPANIRDAWERILAWLEKA